MNCTSASSVTLFAMGLVAAFVTASSTFAQDEAQPQDAPQDQYEFDVTDPSGQDFKFVIGGGLEYQFETDIDGGGDFSVARFGAGIAMHTDFNSELSASFRFGVGIDIYDFGGAPLELISGVEPWKDVHTFTGSALFNWRFDPDWSLFAGPIVQSSRESGADFGDSMTYGGTGGITVRASKDLTIGGGVAVMSQLEDNPRIVPIIILDWAITNDLFLRTTSASNVAARNGLELVWEFSRDWEIAAGGAYQFSRFRLDDGGPVPSGVGEETSIPIWFRATYKPSKSLSIDVVAGIAINGQLQIDDSNGLTLVKQDYSDAFFIGTFASFRF